MRPFYIIKNKHGFYSVSFVNQETGERTSYKSTHTSDYSQAMMTATLWLRDGITETQAQIMRFFNDLLFGTSTSENKRKINTANLNDLTDDYENYYGELHDDAICGDQSATEEINEEFWDAWESEY